MIVAGSAAKACEGCCCSGVGAWRGALPDAEEHHQRAGYGWSVVSWWHFLAERSSAHGARRSVQQSVDRGRSEMTRATHLSAGFILMAALAWVGIPDQARADGNKRPFSDWLSAQGTF